MWRNYLTVGIRALLKSKTYAFINIFGMALALAPCLILLLFVRYETSYDRWVPGADHIFQLQTSNALSLFGPPRLQQTSSLAARAALVKDFPQIEKAVQLNATWSASVLQNGEASIPKYFLLSDGNLFDIIQLPFIAGDPKHALDQPGDLVLTQDQANRYFPHHDALGKTLTLILESDPADYRITGILRDLPKNSHLRLGMILRYDMRSLHTLPPQNFTDFGWTSYYSYFKLRPGTDVQAINAQLGAWKNRNIPASDPKNIFDPRKNLDFKLANIRDIHLGTAQGNMTPGTDKSTLVTFGMIALLILGMAVVNFINLATARGSQRAREVALRKVAGATRRQLIVQFLSESILVTAFAMLLGLVIAELLLPRVNAFLDIDMAIHYFGSEGLLLPILALILIVGTAGGVYPAFYLSRVQPARVLKANKSAAETEGSGRLRNILVVGQFAVSIGLIICTAIVYAQTLYARTATDGYQREGLLQVGSFDESITQSQRETLRREVGKITGVGQAALTSVGVDSNRSNLYVFRIPPSPKPVSVAMNNVDMNFFDTMGMTLLAGRKLDEKIAMDNFSSPPNASPKERGAQYSRGMNIIATELAIRMFGFANPQAAIGKELKAEGIRFTVVGVVQDVRFGSVRRPLVPALYILGTESIRTLMVRYDAPDPGRVSAEIEKIWRRVIPTLPVQAELADDRLRELYQPEEARGRLFGAFALVAVVIGCLGLFGLAAFTADRRTKEIGIRKVLGAKTQNIVGLLTWQFTRPVLIANLIAWPVAWWVMRDWLNGFDARIALSPVYFLAAGALALLIAIATIAGHAFKVARAKPIRALRYE